MMLRSQMAFEPTGYLGGCDRSAKLGSDSDAAVITVTAASLSFLGACDRLAKCRDLRSRGGLCGSEITHGRESREVSDAPAERTIRCGGCG
ncbi:MAG: hypothetical protein K8U57_19805 [Planctomycetes bacterium]|nr:hypothetical protein [Planctomycetota bacterium]